MNTQNNTTTCPKCGGEMERGVLGDSYTTTATKQQKWGSSILLKILGLKDAKNVTTYRCTSCGYLESYAN